MIGYTMPSEGLNYNALVFIPMLDKLKGIELLQVCPLLGL